MTKPIKPTFKRYVVVGRETSFTYPYQLDKATDIQVFRTRDGVTTGLTEAVDFDVNNLGNPRGGTITPLIPQLPLTIGDIWSLLRIQSVDRPKNFKRRGPFAADESNPQFQKIVRNEEDAERDADEAIRQDPAIISELNPLIPQPKDRRALLFVEDAGKFSMVVSNSDPDNIEGTLGDAELAAAQAAAAASAADLSETAASLLASSADGFATNAENSAAGVPSLYKTVVIFSGTPTLAQNGVSFNVDTDSFSPVNLPTQATLGSADYRVAFTKVAGSNDLVLDPPGASTINGSASNFVLPDMFALVDAVYDGATDNWIVSARTGQDERILQIQTKTVSTVNTGNGNITQSDSIPTSSQGTQAMDIAITPKEATSRLKIKCHLIVSTVALFGTAFTIALFRDGVATAFACSAQETSFGTFSGNQGTATREMKTLIVSADIPANSTNQTIIRVRFGSGGGTQTYTLNGKAGLRKFGGVASSIIFVKEYQV